MQSFESGINQGLTKAGLEYAGITSFATPRRLTVMVEALADRQPDQSVERRGPAVQAAFDEAGEPTKALLGFARSCGVEDVATLERLKTDKGEWVVYRATEAGQTLETLIGEIVDNALAGLPIARRMRWGKNRAEFVRPIKWLCSLYGDNVLPLSVFGLGAGAVSRGHRFMSDGEFAISNANDYVEACRAQHVMVDFAERRALILEQIQDSAAGLSATAVIDEDLLDEVTALVEWPVALAGEFDSSFLAVPPEALISAMKEHQRYFHLVDDNGALINRFITVSNIISKDPAVVVGGNERVIRPRLADAAFFYEQDAKVSLSAKIERLDQVIFQTDLGSYGDKTSRITELAEFVAEQLQLDKVLTQRASQLCKVDLITDMVGEFPDLQGIMGGYYATRDGEAQEVADAIADHYRPTQSGGELPRTAIGNVVALSDKLDTLVGLFGIGQPPTGSRDPFALRRQSLGIIRICIENDLDLDITGCLKKAADLHGFEDKVVAEVQDYLCERLQNWYLEQDIGGDIVDAVRAGVHGVNHLAKTHRVVTTLHSFRKEPVAEQIIAANKRVANILKKEPNEFSKGSIDTSLLVDEAENSLLSELNDKQGVTDISDVGEQLQQLAALQPAVDRFFDDVMVMVEDEKVRANRLQLLANLRLLFLEVADFSLLQ